MAQTKKDIDKKIPNEETKKAIEELEKKELPVFKNVDELFGDLDKE